MAFTSSDFLFHLLITLSLTHVKAWTNEDFEVFDVVEEVNTNFYDLLGVEQVHSDPI